MTLVDALVVVLVSVGLLGSLIPFLPGTPLILAGAALHAAATGFDPIGPGRLAVLTLLALAGYGLDYAAGALGARRFGGSGWAVAGALVGGIAGLFFGLPGLLLAPFLGAVAGELVHTRALDRSLRSGLGALIGLVVGAIARVGVAVLMAGLVLWWAAWGG